MSLRAAIVTHHSESSIAACLASLPRGLEVTVWDNASGDRSAEIVRSRFPWVELIESPRNLGFGAAHNRIWRAHQEELLLLLNPDARLAEGCLERLERRLRADGLALVAPRLSYEDGRPQLSYGSFPGLLSDFFKSRRQRAVAAGEPAAVAALERELARQPRPDWVSGACWLVRRESLARLGGFDEDFFLYLEDVDFCRRLRAAGEDLALEARARCIHLEGGSHSSSQAARRHYRRSRALYERKWGSRLGAWLYGRLRAVDSEREGASGGGLV